MKQLKKFSPSKISHEALASFARTTMSYIVELAEDLFLIRQNEAVIAHLEELDLAFQRILKNSFTQKLELIDYQRDQLIVALRSALRAAIDQAILNTDKAEAAEKIITLVNHMDAKVTTLGYLEESAQITAFFTAVKELQAGVVETAEVTPILIALETTQGEFDALFNEKGATNAAKTEVRRIKDIRKDLTLRLNGILSYVNINGIDLPEQFCEIIESLNALITEVMAKAKADATRKENSEE